MVWALLLVFVLLTYYFIIKSASKVSSKVLSLLSGLLLILTIMPFWNESLFSYLININVFLPFAFGVLGVVFGWLGIKDGVRGFLVTANSLAIAFYLIIFLIGTFGFQEP